MSVRINGTERDDVTTVAEAVRATTTATRGIAVALNGEVVPKGNWDQPLKAGDDIEILTATQGG